MIDTIGYRLDDMGLGKTIELISLILTNQPSSPVQQPQQPLPPPPPTPDPYSFLPGRAQPPRPPPASGGTIPSKATLIICPLSTVANWEDQIASHVTEGALKVYVYHGVGRETNAAVLAGYDVVITTYNVLSLEYGRNLKAVENGERERPGSPLQAVYWYRVVLDEAHVIKERTTHQSKAACALRAERRWCLT